MRKLDYIFLALVATSGLAMAGEPLRFRYHFGLKPESQKAASVAVVLDPAQTSLDLGSLTPAVHEFQGVLVNTASEAHRVGLYDGNATGIGRVQIGLPPDTVIPAGGSLTFKVRYDAHGMVGGEEAIVPVVFTVDGNEEQRVEVTFSGSILRSPLWAYPQRLILTNKGTAPRTWSRFEFRSHDGSDYDDILMEDADTPLRITLRDRDSGVLRGRLDLDARGTTPEGKPAAKQGETRLLLMKDGRQADAVSVQWDIK